jgi:hypothetical protein
MDILTKSELLSYSEAKKTYRSLNESLKTFSSGSKYNKITIFLSHKHDEIEELEATISFLKKFGIDVYVDWMDEEMPKYTSGKTADRIKKKIKENDKFILLATDGAISSKWCNWELGYGDAQKYIDNIAILPVKKDYGQYNGSEYLHIYPYIDKRENFHNTNFVVVFPNRKELELGKWLNIKRRML